MLRYRCDLLLFLCSQAICGIQVSLVLLPPCHFPPSGSSSSLVLDYLKYLHQKPKWFCLYRPSLEWLPFAFQQANYDATVFPPDSARQARLVLPVLAACAFDETLVVQVGKLSIITFIILVAI